MTIDQKQATAFRTKLDRLLSENDDTNGALIRPSYARVLEMARTSLMTRIAKGEFPKQPTGRTPCTPSTASRTKLQDVPTSG